MVLEDSIEQYVLMGSKIDILEDPDSRLTIQEVSSPDFAQKFKRPDRDIPLNTNKNASYWIRFTIKNESRGSKQWILEFLDFRIDEIDFYEPDEERNFKVKKGGDSYKFNTKEYLHKNFIYNINLPPSERTYYARVKASESVSIFAEIESQNLLTHYSVNEYFFLALFYGVIIALGLFNIFLFVTSRDCTYLYYVFYISSVAIYSMSQDGTGFQYLWPEYPWFNHYASSVAVFSMVFWVLIYARSFLTVKGLLPVFNKVVIVALGLRSILFVLGLGTIPSLLYMPWVDISLVLIAYIAGILAWKNGFKSAGYYVVGFTFMYAGFLVTTLSALGIIPNSLFTVYGFNFGVLNQMFLFAFALASRIKEVNKEKELMEEKNRELDTFVYKASHDIKGPLKSIIGLTKVGAQDIKSAEAKNYFDLILKSTKRLDTILADLIMVTRVKQAESKKSKIDFDKMIKEVLSSFEYLPSYKEMDFKISIKQNKDFHSDATLLYSVFQNLIENAIKYKKPSVPLFNQVNEERSYLQIEVGVMQNGTTVVFRDNGLGISKEAQKQIFDMFFRVEGSNNAGSGLGLYLVKISVQKLGGTIVVDGEEGKGSIFTIRFAN